MMKRVEGVWPWDVSVADDTNLVAWIEIIWDQIRDRF